MAILTPRFWFLAMMYGVGALLVLGIPTVLIPNAIFGRLIPPTQLDYVFWCLSSLLIGPLLALSTLYPTIGKANGQGRTILASVLSFISIGCPTCNKIVVLLLGMTGAVTIFDPLRPLIGLVSLALLGVTLYLKVRTVLYGCKVNLSTIQKSL